MPGRSAQAAGRVRTFLPPPLRRLRSSGLGLLEEAFVVQGEVNPADVCTERAARWGHKHSPAAPSISGHPRRRCPYSAGSPLLWWEPGAGL
jgi:hypothetical protein